MSTSNANRADLLFKLERYFEEKEVRTHCEDAIALVDRSLALTSQSDEPEIWAKLNMMLGRFAVVWGYEQNDMPLIRRGMDACRTAQAFWIRARSPDMWIKVQKNLANGWLALGELEEDAALLHTAVAEFDRLVEETPRAADPAKWATVMSALGNCRYRLGVVSGDPDYLDQAISSYEASLEVWQRDHHEVDWSNQTFNIALCLNLRASLEGSLQTYELSIEKLTTSLSAVSREADPIDWGSRKNSIANANAAIGALTGSPDHFRAALREYEEALEVFPRDKEPAWWAMLTQNVIISFDGLGWLLRDPNLLRDGIDRAVDAVLTATKEEMPNYWAGIIGICAHSRIGLARLLNDARPLKKAISELTSISEVRTREGVPLQWAYNMQYRGSVKSELGRAERDADMIAAAVDDFEQSISIFNKDNAPGLWRSAATERAEARAALGGLLDDPVMLERAIAEFDEILSVPFETSRPMAHSRTQLGRAEAILMAEHASTPSDRLAIAAEDFTSVADDVSAAVDPARFMRARRGIATVHSLRGDWRAAADAAEQLLIDAERLLIAAPADHSRAELTKALTGVGDLAAYAYARLGQLERALAVLERGRAFQLRARLSEVESDLAPADATRLQEARLALTRARRAYQAALESEDGDVAARQLLDQVTGLHADFSTLLDRCGLDPVAQPPQLREIQDAVSTGEAEALIVFMATRQGGAAIVVPERAEAEVLWLPGLSVGALEAALWTPDKNGWLDRYDRFRSALVRTHGYGDAASMAAWNDAINETREALWSMGMGSLFEYLQARGVTGDSTIAVVPNGQMSALPLHVAGDGDGCFLDEWAVCTTPSITAFVTSEKRAAEQGRSARNLLAATDPNGDLATANNPATDHFPEDRRKDLAGPQASRDAVMQALPHCSYASFFTHAWWEPDRPERSWIQLAGNDRIEARDFAELDLNQCRMIVLGACESGVPGLKQSPDEFEGLPTSLLQAGVPGVLATLWPVFNQTSAALISRFFQDHVKNGCSPAQALQRAQRALRDGTVELEPVTHPRAAFWIEQDESEPLRAQGIRPSGEPARVERQSFDPSQPMFWAAFVYLGA